MGLLCYLIDGGLWTRYQVIDGKLIYEPHAAGADPNDTVVLASETALHGLIEGRITVDRAVKEGLVVITVSPGPHAYDAALSTLQRAFEQAARL